MKPIGCRRRFVLFQLVSHHIVQSAVIVVFMNYQNLEGVSQISRGSGLSQVGRSQSRITALRESKASMRAAMETVVLDDHRIQRREGSVGLVIFERDDILLRHRPQLADQTLRDIDTEFLAMLQDMRELGVRFGFVWHHTTSRSGRGARIDSATLTRLLDDLLKVSGAVPDFWIEAIHSPGPVQLPETSDLDVILKLTEWYDVDPTMTVLVRKGEFHHYSSTTPAFTEILYPGLSAGGRDSDRRAALVWLKTKIKHALKLP
ncbi:MULTISPECIES: hypothetical protein [Rhizobium]|nr:MULTISPECIES: hypothetical protein [Rhizobium]